MIATDACPGTELTYSMGPGGVNATNTAGVFIVMITELPAGGGIVSALRYNATQTSGIVCNDGAVTTTHIFISHK